VGQEEKDGNDTDAVVVTSGVSGDHQGHGSFTKGRVGITRICRALVAIAGEASEQMGERTDKQ
jgi:hypothetical protein